MSSSDSAGLKPEGVDVRIAVYDRMTYDGNRVPVNVDRTRILVVPS